MATELGKAYVQIIPSAKGIGGSISSAIKGEATSAGQSAGLNIAGAIKGAIAAAGIGTAIKSALEAGGNLQQSFGGLETLYGDAAEGAKKYAAEAAKAGISANNYAEQAVSFGASLKQAFAGDTQAAMEAANTAIIDMADNAAKMGTPIESIQNAYQGFAKQNYTMLDNLKLGYGGTKEEMERLLEDAQKLSGVEYNIDNLGDVYAAIHVIQEDLGLTGVAAAEASETFSGSLGAMKAAGENLLANLALGEDIGPALNALGETVQAFLFKNLFPMIGNMLEQLPELLSGLSGILIQSLNMVTNNADDIVKIAIDLVTALVQAIVEVAPYLLEAALSLVAALGEALITTDWNSVATDLINGIRESLDLAAGEILGQDTATIDGILDGISAGLPDLLSSGVDIITNIANGILESIPDLVTTAGDIVVSFAEFLMENYPKIMESGVELILNLVDGIVKSLPDIATSVITVIGKLVVTFAKNYPKLLQTGIELIGKLIVGIIKAIPQVIAAIPQIINAIKTTFGNVDWGQVGRDLITGIANGIKNAVGWIVDAAREAAESAFEAAKSWLGISSPSKKGMWMGSMYDEGIAIGIAENAGEVEKATNALVNDAFNDIAMPQTSFNIASVGQNAPGNLTLNMTINGAEGQDVNVLAEIIQNKINTAVNQRELVYA